MTIDPRAAALRERATALRRTPAAGRAHTAQVDPVRRLYERFPYPGARAAAPIHDVVNAVESVLATRDLRGWRVLDAGCGTGQRLIALAARHPEAAFVGIDVSLASLEAAARLMRDEGVSNVELREEDLMALGGERYDLALCTGVIHHLADPRAGIARLSASLGDEGLLYVWLYHALGEFDRLLRRDLVRLLCGDADDLSQGLGVVAALGVPLAADQYGLRPAPGAEPEDDPAADADAYLHPRVRAYRFLEALSLFDACEAAWAAIVGCTIQGGGMLLDLEGLGDESERLLSLDPAVLFAAGDLFARYERLGKADKLHAIELAVKPTGVALVAGRRAALGRCRPWVAGNVLDAATCEGAARGWS